MINLSYIKGLSADGKCTTKILFPTIDQKNITVECQTKEGESIKEENYELLSNYGNNKLTLDNQKKVFEYSFQNTTMNGSVDWIYKYPNNSESIFSSESIFKYQFQDSNASLNLLNAWNFTKTALKWGKSSLTSSVLELIDDSKDSKITIGKSIEILCPINTAETSSIKLNKVNSEIYLGANLNYCSITPSLITTSGMFQANAFNSTSDMRAKINLHTLDLNACDYIKQIPIYSFIYKNNLKPSIGVLAQDLTNKPIDEYLNNFNFVDNMQATGINNDYMSVKESKFIYLCMKAIQELTDENKMLMCKINDLENQIAWIIECNKKRSI